MSEATAIRLSAATNCLYGILGIGFGVWVDSDAILLDGAFNWIFFAMALVTLKVARLIHRPADEKFHFGYVFFEPLVNLVKSLLVLGVAVFALIGAVARLVEGGQPLDPLPALLYAGIAMAGCFLLAAVQHRAAKRTQSPLVAVDAKNWFVNGAVSSAVGVAFLTALLMSGTGWDPVVRYVDPVLVVVLVVVTLPIPWRMAGEGLGDLLSVAPEAAEQEAMRTHFADAAKGHDLKDYALRMAKVGRHFYLQVTAVWPAARPLQGIAELDRIRNDPFQAMGRHHPALVMDVIFTGAADGPAGPA